ncbi:MAG: GTPase, partial [Candidatus Binatia bacterium]
LDRGHFKELLAAAGIGLSSQVLEGYATKLFGGLFGKLGGKIGKSVSNQATSSAMSFAATYAIGQMAQQYYSGGRTLSNLEMRQLFDQLKEEATGLHAKYAGQIQQQS